jgi:hypothetical protein
MAETRVFYWESRFRDGGQRDPRVFTGLNRQSGKAIKYF